MPYEAVGTLYKVFPEQQITERFRKREFILSVQDGMYVQLVKFTLKQDRCNLIEGYKLGAELKVTFSISGREVQGKDGEPLYFTSLDAWKIEPLKDAPMGQDLSSPFDTSDDVPF
jgi:single-strand DNA-binding protein